MLIGTNLNEFVHGVDHPDAYSLTPEQLEDRLKPRYGERATAIIAAYRKEYPDATAVRPSLGDLDRLVPPGGRGPGDAKAAPARRRPTTTCSPGGPPCSTAAPGRSTAPRSRSSSTTPTAA